MTILDINTAVKNLLNNFDGLNTHIGYEGDVFGGATEDELDDWNEQLDETRPYIIGQKLDSGFRAEVKDWHSHAVCLTGLSFDKPLIFDLAEAKMGVLHFSATLTGGVGARYLYKALGSCSLTVEIPVTYDWLKLDNGEDQILAVFQVKSASVNLTAKTAAELDEILSSVTAQSKRFQNQLLMSQISRSYKNFHKLTGLDSKDFYKPYVKNE